MQGCPNAFIAGSVISGFGAGLNELVALSGTAELVPARLRGIYVAGLVFTILPFVAATLYAQLIAAAVSWRYVGIMVAGWNLIGLILVAAVYKPPPRVNSQGFSRSEILRRVDYVGGLLSTGGVMCFMMGMQWGATQVRTDPITKPNVNRSVVLTLVQYQWTSVHVLVPFFIGIALIVAFFVWEVKLAPYPMVPPRMFTKSKRTMIITLFITFLSGSNYFVLLLLWPTENYNIYGKHKSFYREWLLTFHRLRPRCHWPSNLAYRYRHPPWFIHRTCTYIRHQRPHNRTHDLLDSIDDSRLVLSSHYY